MFQVDPDGLRPLYMQVADGVRWGVLRGSLRPDDPLPSVRELAGRLRLNPNTIQQGYRELEREGLVCVRRGQGTFVAPGVERERLRDAVAREVGERCLAEAHRAGLSLDELITGLRAAAAHGDTNRAAEDLRRAEDPQAEDPHSQDPHPEDPRPEELSR